MHGNLHREILRDPDFERAVTERLHAGGTTRLDTTRWGEISLTVQPVTDAAGQAAFLDVGGPDDVAETRALLLDEVDRMPRLVEDFIVLAPADTRLRPAGRRRAHHGRPSTSPS